MTYVEPPKEPHKILRTEFCDDFVTYMKNRMVTSAFKYGLVSDKQADPLWHKDMLKNAKYRIKAYEQSGNTEFLVDAANFLMLEFMEMHGWFLPTDGTKYSKII